MEITFAGIVRHIDYDATIRGKNAQRGNSNKGFRNVGTRCPCPYHYEQLVSFFKRPVGTKYR